MYCKISVLGLFIGVSLFACGFSKYVDGIFNETRRPSRPIPRSKRVDNNLRDKQYGTLVFTSVIYRHGDRTPVEPYPLDPYKNLSYWPVGWGQLTNRGKKQHYELGQWLRQRYGMLLNNSYSKDDIYVRSTDVDRTLMSAESNLAGLYMPQPPQVWNPSIMWQPIPVHTVPEQLDELLAGKKSCPRYDQALSEVKKSKAMQEINRKYADLYQYLAIHTGKNISDVIAVEYIYNTLFIENLYNFTLPPWTKTVFPDKMSLPAALSFTVLCFTKEMGRLKSGPLLGEITRHMKQKINRKLSPDRKMFMYSGHDLTLANMLMTLGVFDVQCPPYASTILFDLWQKEQEYFVTVMYKNSTDDPYILEIPGCVKLCPLKHFLALTEPLIPSNWEDECIIKNLRDVAKELGEYPAVFIGLILFGVLIITMSVCFVMTLIHYRQNKSQFLYQRLPVSTRENMFQPV